MVFKAISINIFCDQNLLLLIVVVTPPTSSAGPRRADLAMKSAGPSIPRATPSKVLSLSLSNSSSHDWVSNLISPPTSPHWCWKLFSPDVPSPQLLLLISRSLSPSTEFTLSQCPSRFTRKTLLLNFEVCLVYTKETHRLEVHLTTCDRNSGKSHSTSAPSRSDSISPVDASSLILHALWFSSSAVAL